MNTYLTISSFLTLLASLLVIGLVSSSPERGAVHRRYVYFLFCIAAWSFFYCLWRLSSEAESAFTFCKLLMLAVAFIPVTFLRFSLALSDLNSRFGVFLGVSLALVFAFLVPFDGLIVDGVSARYGHLYWPSAGVLMPLFLLYYCAFLLFSVIVLIIGWRKHIGRRASDQSFVIFSGLVGFIGGGTNFPLWYNIPIQPYGNILVFAYIFLVGYGLYRNRISGLGIDIYRMFVGLLLNGSVALFYLLAIKLYKTLLGVPFEARDVWWHFFSAYLISMVIFWIVPRVKSFAEKILESVFYNEKKDSLKELKDLAVSLSDYREDIEVFEAVGTAIMRSLNVKSVVIYTLDTFERDYSCKYLIGSSEKLTDQTLINYDSPVVEVICQKFECLVLDDIYDQGGTDFYQALVSLRNDLGLSIIVPIFANHELYGMIFVGELVSQRIWREEEISILFSIGAQMGLNKRTRDFERKSMEMDKLVALGTMAAGLAHEIRNPLVSVQTLASLVQQKRAIEKVPDDFKSILVRDVKRIGSIVEGVARYAENKIGKLEVVNIADVIEASLDIYRPKMKTCGIELIWNVDSLDDYRLLANFEQLVQVFNNLIENAIHALDGVDHPRIQIHAEKIQARNEHSWIDVSVADNGPGIAASIMNTIFDPFTTSKDTGLRVSKEGMGLGLAITKRIIEGHEGSIRVFNVKSPQATGATFVVSFKSYDPNESS